MATPAWDAGGNIINLTRKEKLMQRAKENGEIFEKILHQHPGLERETVEAIVYDANDPEFGDVKPLKAENCPKFKHSSGRTGARILVIHGDTIETALGFHCGAGKSVTTVREQFEGDQDIAQRFTQVDKDQAAASLRKDSTMRASISTNENLDSHVPPEKPLLILNCANATSPGGDWRIGNIGQEEELFYRTSLSCSLHPKYYPLKGLTAIYSPKVFMIRGAFKDAHRYVFPPEVIETKLPDHPLAMTLNPRLKYGVFTPDEFKVFSILSIAADRDPPITEDGSYANPADYEAMEQKIRTFLRISVHQGHTKLIMAALGCGKAKNPAKGVATAFLCVFNKAEFQGGWWEEIIFAVNDDWEDRDEEKKGTQGSGIFETFFKILDSEFV